MGNDIGSDGHNHNLNLAITKSLFGFRLLYAFVKIWHCIIQARMPRETAFTFVEAAGFSCDEPLSILFKMTKAELQNALAEATQTDKRTAGVFLDTLGAIAYKATKKSGEFVVPGFGKLVKQKRKARTGLNPKTQQKIKISAKTVLKFRVFKVAKDAILGAKK